jgi:hypothetical protein
MARKKHSLQPKPFNLQLNWELNALGGLLSLERNRIAQKRSRPQQKQFQAIPYSTRDASKLRGGPYFANTTEGTMEIVEVPRVSEEPM